MSATELRWVKSSYSSSSDINDCVEVASTPAAAHIRDSKAPDAAHMTVTPATWAGFLRYVTE
ncbi:DUF397 domain-containing protein [Streptomyces massasporeus]|uniref:DUF397 domain-containing protein n=1 Tax=Streptomyces massasporeus TaxID=67324 RepID=UPI003451B1E9